MSTASHRAKHGAGSRVSTRTGRSATRADHPRSASAARRPSDSSARSSRTTGAPSPRLAASAKSRPTSAATRHRTRRRASGPDLAQRSSELGFRRGLALLAVTLVVPGLVQLVRGHRSVGRWALRAWLVLVIAVVTLVALGLTRRNAAIAVVTNSVFLHLLQVVVLVAGAAMVFLIADSWRLSRPAQLRGAHRLGFTLITLMVCVAVAAGTWNGARMIGAQAGMWGTVLGGGGKTDAHAGRINVLLLGGDAGQGREGMRFDSITVASVDVESGRTVLFSLPRNLEGAIFSSGSPLRNRYPNGYDCADHSCLLNAIYTLGRQHADLYPDADDPGIQATIEAVEGTLGLPLNYYALIDLLGFQTLIDALGGVNLDILVPVAMAGHDQEATLYLQPGKNVHLTGYQALWFVRSRHGSTDYERMVRQKCVMNAVLKQVSPQVVLANFTALSQAGKEIVETNVPSGAVGQLMDLATKARDLPVASVSFTPPLVYPGNPKIAVIHATVEQTIQRAEDADRGKSAAPSAASTSAAAGGSSSAPTSAKPSAVAPRTQGAAPPATDDLSKICSVP